MFLLYTCPFFSFFFFLFWFLTFFVSFIKVTTTDEMITGDLGKGTEEAAADVAEQALEGEDEEEAVVDITET